MSVARDWIVRADEVAVDVVLGLGLWLRLWLRLWFGSMRRQLRMIFWMTIRESR